MSHPILYSTLTFYNANTKNKKESLPSKTNDYKKSSFRKSIWMKNADTKCKNCTKDTKSKSKLSETKFRLSKINCNSTCNSKKTLIPLWQTKLMTKKSKYKNNTSKDTRNSFSSIKISSSNTHNFKKRSFCKTKKSKNWKSKTMNWWSRMSHWRWKF